MEENLINKSMFSVAGMNPWKPWLAASIAAVLILLITFGLMEFHGLFDIPENDQGLKTFAAVLGLIGAILTAAVTLVGIVVKYAIDDHNARHAAMEANRSYALAVQAEKRNRIEAAIRAVDLLGENNKNATECQISGAVLALVSLGELDLAVNLLAQLWPAKMVSNGVAESVALSALSSDSEDAQISIAEVLYNNVDRLWDEDSYFWPIPKLGWRSDLNRTCRIWLATTLGEWLKAELSINRVVQPLPHPAAVLYAALTDNDPGVLGLAVACLKPIAQHMKKDLWVITGDKKLSVADIADRLAETTDYSDTWQAQTFGLEIKNLILSKIKKTSVDSNDTE